MFELEIPQLLFFHLRRDLPPKSANGQCSYTLLSSVVNVLALAGHAVMALCARTEAGKLRASEARMGIFSMARNERGSGQRWHERDFEKT